MIIWLERKEGTYIIEFIHLVSDILEYTEEINVTEILFSADFETPLTTLTITLYLALFNLFYLDSSLFIVQHCFIEWWRLFLANTSTMNVAAQ